MTPSVTRLGHSARRRLLAVRHVADLAPRLRRVTLGGDLEGFSSPAPDDHVKLFFPDPGVAFDPQALLRGEGVSAGRDYTPRRHNPVAGELDLDFVLHGAGVGSTWAAQARPGTPLVLGGPRGSLLVEGFPAYLLGGDEAALPSIARRLEELPAGVRAQVFIEVDSPADELPLSSAAHLELTWLHRQGAKPGSTDLLGRALRAAPISDDTFVWAGCEQAAASSLRQHFQEERGLRTEWVRVTGYWRRAAEEREGNV